MIGNLDAVHVQTAADSLLASKLTYGGYYTAHEQGQHERALALVRRSVDLDPETSGNWTARVRASLVFGRTVVGDHRRADRQVERAFAAVRRAEARGDTVSAFRRARLHEAAINTVVWRGLDAWTPCAVRTQCYFLTREQADGALRHARQAERLYRASGRTRRISFVDAYRAGTHLLRRNVEQARTAAGSAHRQGVRHAYAWGQVVARLMQARIDLTAGRLDAADADVAAARAVIDTTSSDDARAIRANLGVQADRLASLLNAQRGRYAHVLASLWSLRLSNAPAAPRHFAVAQASTLPLYPTSGGLGALLVATILVAGVVRRAESPSARFLRTLRRDGRPFSPPASTGAASSGAASPGPASSPAGTTGADGNSGTASTGDRRAPRGYQSLIEQAAPELLAGTEGVYELRMLDDTMEPLFFRHDTLHVEAVAEFEGDGVYLFAMNGSWHVKRLRRREDALHVVPANDTYAAYRLPAGADWQVHGRVVGWAPGVHGPQ